MKLWIKKALKSYKKKLLRIINALVYDEGILERRNPKVLLTASAACTGVLYGQKAMKFVTFIFTISLNRELLISFLLQNKAGIPRASSASLHETFGHIIRSARFRNITMSSEIYCGKGMMEDWAYIFYDWPDTGCIEKQQIIAW